MKAYNKPISVTTRTLLKSQRMKAVANPTLNAGACLALGLELTQALFRLHHLNVSQTTPPTLPDSAICVSRYIVRYQTRDMAMDKLSSE